MRRLLLRGRVLRLVHGERSGYPGFGMRHRGTYVETEENRRGLLRGRGPEGSGGGAPGPGGGVLGKCERFTGLEQTPPQVGVFQVASRSQRVPSPFHSFRRSLDTSFMLILVYQVLGRRRPDRDPDPAPCQRLSSLTTRTRGGPGMTTAWPGPFQSSAEDGKLRGLGSVASAIRGQPEVSLRRRRPHMSTSHPPIRVPTASHTSSPGARERASRRAQTA